MAQPAQFVAQPTPFVAQPAPFVVPQPQQVVTVHSAAPVAPTPTPVTPVVVVEERQQPAETNRLFSREAIQQGLFIPNNCPNIDPKTGPKSIDFLFFTF